MYIAKKKSLTAYLPFSNGFFPPLYSMQGCSTTTEVKKRADCRFATLTLNQSAPASVLMDLTQILFRFKKYSSVKDEADNRIAFLKKAGSWRLDDYPEILNNKKKKKKKKKNENKKIKK
jgi:hypothetical protein